MDTFIVAAGFTAVATSPPPGDDATADPEWYLVGTDPLNTAEKVMNTILFTPGQIFVGSDKELEWVSRKDLTSGTFSSTLFNGIYESTNDGQSWTKTSNGSRAALGILDVRPVRLEERRTKTRRPDGGWQLPGDDDALLVLEEERGAAAPSHHGFATWQKAPFFSM